METEELKQENQSLKQKLSELENKLPSQTIVPKLAIYFLILFVFIISVVYFSIFIILEWGHHDWLDSVEKVNFFLLGVASSLIGYIGSYYFQSRKGELRGNDDK